MHQLLTYARTVTAHRHDVVHITSVVRWCCSVVLFSFVLVCCFCLLFFFFHFEHALWFRWLYCIVDVTAHTKLFMWYVCDNDWSFHLKWLVAASERAAGKIVIWIIPNLLIMNIKGKINMKLRWRLRFDRNLAIALRWERDSWDTKYTLTSST